MRYFWTIFWAFLLGQMLDYVVGSMVGTPFNFETGAIIGIVIIVGVLILTSIIPNEPVEKH